MDLGRMFCVSVWFAGREATALTTYVAMDPAEDQRLARQRDLHAEGDRLPTTAVACCRCTSFFLELGQPSE